MSEAGETTACNIVHAWIRDCDSTTIKMRMAPDVIDPLVDAIAKAISEAEARGRREAFEAAAKIAEEGSFPFDIEVWMGATKKEMTANIALSIASAIRARAQKETS